MELLKLINKNSNPAPQTANTSTYFAAFKERTFLPACRGSLTIEAAVVLPLFMFFSLAIIYFLLIISLQADIQLRIEETARDAGRRAYLLKNSSTTSVAGINSLTLKSGILDQTLTTRINNSAVVDGSSGISTLLSTYDAESGLLDVTVTYKYKIPFFPEAINTIRCMQHCSCRVWIGKELSETDTGDNSSTKQTVYITPTGTAYHLTTSCPYLDLSVRSVSYGSVSRLRNLSGRIYERCSSCAKSGTVYSNVYVTNYGTNWHASLECSGLKRTVSAVDISEVGDRHLCSKCGKSSQDQTTE